jgi:NAD(P)-dependent dehydrogenase (short-subunit alcohol dehydrogenase family)
VRATPAASATCSMVATGFALRTRSAAYDAAIWQQVFDLNLFSAVRACRAAMPSVVRRDGLVVILSSVGAPR